MNYKRLCWGSRRGMLELDLVLLPFVEEVFPGLSEEDQQLYAELLECEDQDMFSWFLKRQDPAEPRLLRIVEMIREHTARRTRS